MGPASEGSGAAAPVSDLNSRLSGMNYDSFTTPSKDNYSISEFLTKIAHGEKLDVHSFIAAGGERKRRRTSGERDGHGVMVTDWLVCLCRQRGRGRCGSL